VPVKRIPKTTSGKIQRHLLEEDFLNGGQDAELAEIAKLRAELASMGGARVTSSEIERQLKDIADAALARASTCTTTCSEIEAPACSSRSTSRSTASIPGCGSHRAADFPTIAELAKHIKTRSRPPPEGQPPLSPLLWRG
jgi:hypothetical protein